MRGQVYIRSLLLLLATVCIGISLQTSENRNQEEPYKFASLQHYRYRRATRRPGFLRTLFSVIYEQWADARNTSYSLNKMINDNFIDEREAMTSTTPSSNPNVSTTAAPYRITRTEFNRILRRNLNGLVRLYNIELQDALKGSDRTNEEFRRNLSMEVSKYL